MRRDYFTLDVSDVDWVDEGGDPAKPTVRIDFEGPASALEEQLTGTDDEFLDADGTDVAFRLQSSLDEPDATGVVSSLIVVPHGVVLPVVGPSVHRSFPPVLRVPCHRRQPRR